MARLEDYSFGRVRADGSAQKRDLIVLPDRIVTPRGGGSANRSQLTILTKWLKARLAGTFDPQDRRVLRERSSSVTPHAVTPAGWLLSTEPVAPPRPPPALLHLPEHAPAASGLRAPSSS